MQLNPYRVGSVCQQDFCKADADTPKRLSAIRKLRKQGVV